MIPYRKTQFSIITLYTSSITMGTGHLVNTNPSNITSCARDIGCSIYLNSSGSVTLLIQLITTELLGELPVTIRLPFAPNSVLINCNRSRLKLFPTSNNSTHLCSLAWEEMFVTNSSS